MDYIICHYSEIGLKGKNRRFFEEKLVENIKRVLKPAHFAFVKRISGRIIIRLSKEGAKNEREITQVLRNVFGMAYFAFAVSCPQKINKIQEKALELLKGKKFKTFKISTQRSKKEFPLTSQEINERVGKYILQRTENKEQRTKIKVDLEKPDITCFIEIVDLPPLFVEEGLTKRTSRKVVGCAFLYLEKIRGLGGLPVSCSGKAAVLLSGGIDSPVAAFLAMKRGIKVIFLHFHAYPYTSEASIEKAKKIVKLLSKHQGKSKLYLIPFAQIQEEILRKTSAKLRVILYRRFMLRIAAQICKKEKALAIFTGESVGQVASQTLENIKVIEESVCLPVFRPLIGQDKEEIINKAKEINTFEISILPYQDCCARFLPKHPETRAKLEEVLRAEKRLNIENLIEEAIKKSSVEKISGACPPKFLD